MKTALGLLEFKTVPVGVAATDETLKAAEVELVLGTPVCPGKYLTIIRGEVAGVTTAVQRGTAAGGVFVVDGQVIPNISAQVPPALAGVGEADRLEALGIIETFAAVAAILAGDLAVKAARVRLIEIRLARGLGGKGEVFFTGELGSVEAAVRAARDRLGREGGLASSVVIARPHPALVKALSV